MGRIIRVAAVALLAAAGVAATTTLSKPEEAGMSAERLRRIAPMIQRHIDEKDFAGAVTLVARRGKVVHFEAHGMADVESRKPMRTDTLFVLASMTKPLTAVSILMLVEEGKVVLNDPVAKFVPEFKNPSVAVWNRPNDPAGAGLRLVPAARSTNASSGWRNSRSTSSPARSGSTARAPVSTRSAGSSRSSAACRWRISSRLVFSTRSA